MFGYAGDNPLIFADPFGLSKCHIDAATEAVRRRLNPEIRSLDFEIFLDESDDAEARTDPTRKVAIQTRGRFVFHVESPGLESSTGVGVSMQSI